MAAPRQHKTRAAARGTLASDDRYLHPKSFRFTSGRCDYCNIRTIKLRSVRLRFDHGGAGLCVKNSSVRKGAELLGNERAWARYLSNLL
jgi:hypothetical protein